MQDYRREGRSVGEPTILPCFPAMGKANMGWNVVFEERLCPDTTCNNNENTCAYVNLLKINAMSWRRLVFDEISGLAFPCKNICGMGKAGLFYTEGKEKYG